MCVFPTKFFKNIHIFESVAVIQIKVLYIPIPINVLFRVERQKPGSKLGKVSLLQSDKKTRPQSTIHHPHMHSFGAAHYCSGSCYWKHISFTRTGHKQPQVSTIDTHNFPMVSKVPMLYSYIEWQASLFNIIQVEFITKLA